MKPVLRLPCQQFSSTTVIGSAFYSYDLAERMHVHVFKSGSECKIWLDDLALAFNRGFKPHEVAEIRRMVSERRAEIVRTMA